MPGGYSLRPATETELEVLSLPKGFAKSCNPKGPVPDGRCFWEREEFSLRGAVGFEEFHDLGVASHLGIAER